MNCEEVELQLLDHQRGKLPPTTDEEVVAHLARCAACARADREERALSGALEEHLPQHAAPVRLKRRLAELAALKAPAPPRRARATSVARWLAPALAAGLVSALGVLTWERGATRRSEVATLASEAVTDHLRVLSSERRVEIQSGGPHQVKPWFQGKLDFAPDVPEAPPLELQGGRVGYFRGRRAAVLVYTLRLHTVTLLEVPAAGLAWPSSPGEVAREAEDRRFHAFFWRSGDLGYALVSDADDVELAAVARTLAARR